MKNYLQLLKKWFSEFFWEHDAWKFKKLDPIIEIFVFLKILRSNQSSGIYFQNKWKIIYCAIYQFFQNYLPKVIFFYFLKSMEFKRFSHLSECWKHNLDSQISEDSDA